MRRVLFPILGALLCAPTAANAASGLYLQLGLGYGKFGGKELVIQEQSVGGDRPDTGTACCDPGGLASQFRLGFSLFGFGGPEFGLIGHGWRVGQDDTGGAGFVGGGVRLFPIKFLSLAGLDTKDFPIDLGVGALFGWSITGQDFAYTGSFFDIDINLEYKLTSFLSAGLKLDVILPSYGDFAYTSYSAKSGRCLDGEAQQVNVDAGGQPKDNLQCSGRGPKTTLLLPQLVFTFHFDLLEF